MPIPDAPVTFAGWTFDPASGDLARPGDEAAPAATDRLPPKPARLLALLVARPGEVVPRDEVVAELWPDQHLDVDQGLAYTVRQVRAALADDAAEPRYVETLPRRGYRFLVPVEPADKAGPTAIGSAGEGAAADGDGQEDYWDEPPPTRGQALAALLAGLALVALALWLLLAAPFTGDGTADAAAGDGPIRVALLPLTPPASLAEDPAAIAANRRLTEELLVALTARSELDVVGPATTAGLAASRRPQTGIGRELDVAFVVSGGHSPDEAITFLQLVRVADGGHLFARRFTGDEAAFRAAAGEVAATLSLQIEAALRDREEQPP